MCSSRFFSLSVSVKRILHVGQYQVKTEAKVKRHFYGSQCTSNDLIQELNEDILVCFFSVAGHFGCVYAATLRDNALRNPIPVAVKTIEGELLCLLC